MTDIPNTEYITINKDGIFVGGKPATRYCGQQIVWDDDDRDAQTYFFAYVQGQNKNVAELHVLSSETYGKYAKPGNPSQKPGRNAWCRVKFNDGRVGSWVFNFCYESAAACANDCAFACAYHIMRNPVYASAVFDAVEKSKEKSELKKLKKIDFSKLPKKPIELNGYRILVEKISTRTK